MGSYSFGVPSVVIYAQHIIIGLYFVFLGYQLNKLNDFRLHALILFSLGVLMFSYHAHLWYLSAISTEPKKPHYH